MRGLEYDVYLLPPSVYNFIIPLGKRKLKARSQSKFLAEEEFGSKRI
jgi:hypothetical protein